MNFPQKNVSLHDRCSYKIGGEASWYWRPDSVEQLESALAWAQKSDVDVFVLGKGTNVLISDAGWDGLVLDMTGLCTISWEQQRVYAYAGALLHALVTHAVSRGLGGMEQLAGIPGTTGGGVIMNAGAFDQTISDTLVQVDAIDPQKRKIVSFHREKLTFDYRYSNLGDEKFLVLGASFLLHDADKSSLKVAYRDILNRRRAKQPLNIPNCGSVFKRPPGSYAGHLVEQCGLKGFRTGGAKISEKHANFIINDNNARAEDIRKIIATAQKRVYEQTGYLLETEVVFIGEFRHPLYNPTTVNS